MCEKLAERKKREADAWKGKSGKVSDKELFNRMGDSVKVVRK